jgi:acetyltransferase-like isoleucine patch superfamily enzyme
MRQGEFPGAVLRAGRAEIGEHVLIGPGTVIVADDLVLGDGAMVGVGCDLRSARLELGPAAQVGDGSRWLVADRARLGSGTVIDAGAEVTCREFLAGDGTYVGPRLRVGAGASMEERSAVTIGHRCQIAPDVLINPTEPVVIGDEVGISAQVAIWTHGYHAGHPVRDGHEAAFAGAEVASGAWLGFRVTLLPGVRVGEGTIVAATATVTRSLPAGVLAAGVPATVRRHLEPSAMSEEQRGQAVAALAAGWLQRLQFKGLTVEPGPGPARWTVSQAALSWQVALRDGDFGRTSAMEVSGSGGSVVFDFAEPLTVSGMLDELGHDLRDYCRRATWLFPYAGNSTGLMPERFARLLG